MEQIRVLSLFSGIGAFEKALEREKIPFELVNFCEIDKYASRSYCAVHEVDESLNLHDVSTVDTSKLKDIDLLTHGSPCQDFSNAGLGLGGDVDSGTRSSLMWETVRIINDTRPKFIVWEQVPAVLQQAHIHNFRKYNLTLSQMGYVNMYKILNAKNFGVPQNRERVFVVSVRKDVDDNTFIFPTGFELTKKLSDILEDEVPRKYYLSDEQISNFIKYENTNPSGNGISGEAIDGEISRTITTNKGECPKIKIEGTLGGNYRKVNEVLGVDGISTCLDTMQGGNREPKVLCFNWQQSERFKNKTLIDMTATLSTQNNQAVVLPVISPDRREIRQNGRRIKNDGEPMFTLTSMDRHGVMQYPPFSIRKLTPLECWMLMGYDDIDFIRAKNAGISNSQLYKQAGNSIVVDVLQAIFRNLFKSDTVYKVRDIILEQQQLF